MHYVLLTFVWQSSPAGKKKKKKKRDANLSVGTTNKPGCPNHALKTTQILTNNKPLRKIYCDGGFRKYLSSAVSTNRQRGRVVKAIDSKSIGLCPREFESRRCRFFVFPVLFFTASHSGRSIDHQRADTPETSSSILLLYAWYALQPCSKRITVPGSW